MNSNLAFLAFSVEIDTISVQQWVKKMRRSYSVQFQSEFGEKRKRGFNLQEIVDRWKSCEGLRRVQSTQAGHVNVRSNENKRCNVRVVEKFYAGVDILKRDSVRS